MKPQLPFPIPASLHKHLLNTCRKEPAAWLRYTNPDHPMAANDWPQTIEVFMEWNRRHSGIVELAKAAESNLRAAKDDASDESMDMVYGSLCALIESTRFAFRDFADLLHWAVYAWEHDPVIFDHGKDSGGCEAKSDAAEKVVQLG